MGRLLKMALALMLCIGLAGCGQSYDKQEEVVKNFYSYVQTGDTEKMKTICTEDNDDLGEFSTILDDVSDYLDVDTYGQAFVDAADDFVKDVLSKYVVSYEIEKTKKVNDSYEVITKVKVKDYDNVDFNDIDTDKIFSNYQKEHTEEIQELVKSEGLSKAQEKIMGDVGKLAFDEMKKMIDDAGEVEGKIVFKVISQNDKYVISKSAFYKNEK